MSRPKKRRQVNKPPTYKNFCTAGQPANESIALSLDEYEAIRLVDYNSLSHLDASIEMRVSRPTLSRLIENARKKIATFLIEGKELNIVDGDIHFKENVIKCDDCNNAFEHSIGTPVQNCVSCGSSSIQDLAKDYGHGNCCKIKAESIKEKH